MPPIRPHHQAAIDKVVARFQSDPAIHALVVGGSIAKGIARDYSDVDMFFIVTEEDYALRQRESRLFFCLHDLTDYPGSHSFIDVKVQSLSFLREAARCGSEPTRNSFIDAFCVFARDSRETIANLLAGITVYPEQGRLEKITSFLAQIELNRIYFFGEAERENDPYLMHRVISDLVLFGGRLILAHNRIFFPSHKRLLETVARAPEKPADFIPLAHALLKNPTREAMVKFCDTVVGFTNWTPTSDLVTRFIEDSELSWLTRKPSIADT